MPAIASPPRLTRTVHEFDGQPVRVSIECRGCWSVLTASAEIADAWAADHVCGDHGQNGGC